MRAPRGPGTVPRPKRRTPVRSRSDAAQRAAGEGRVIPNVLAPVRIDTSRAERKVQRAEARLPAQPFPQLPHPRTKAARRATVQITGKAIKDIARRRNPSNPNAEYDTVVTELLRHPKTSLQTARYLNQINLSDRQKRILLQRATSTPTMRGSPTGTALQTEGKAAPRRHRSLVGALEHIVTHPGKAIEATTRLLYPAPKKGAKGRRRSTTAALESYGVISPQTGQRTLRVATAPYQVARAFAESGATRRETLKGAKDLPAGILTGLGYAVQHPVGSLEQQLQAWSHIYGPLASGDTKKFRKQLGEEHSGGAVPVALDFFGAGALASKIAGAAARGGALGGRLQRAASEPRPALRFSTGEDRGSSAVAQDLSPRLVKALIQRRRDVSRTRVFEKRMAKAETHPDEFGGYGPSVRPRKGEVVSRGGMELRGPRGRGVVVPLPRHFTAEARLQRRSPARMKGAARVGQVGEQLETTKKFNRQVKSLSKGQKRAFRYVYGGLIHATDPKRALADVNELIGSIERIRQGRAEAGAPVKLPKVRGRFNDELVQLRKIKDDLESGVPLLTGNLHEAITTIRRMEIRTRAGVPSETPLGGRVSQSQLRRYMPQAEVLIRRGKLPPLEEGEKLGSYIERVGLRRVIDAGQAEGLLRPGYFPSIRRYSMRYSDLTTGGRRAMAESAGTYTGELFRTGREDIRPEVLHQALLRNIKRKHNINLVARQVRAHAWKPPAAERVSKEAARAVRREKLRVEANDYLQASRRDGGRNQPRAEEQARVRGYRWEAAELRITEELEPQIEEIKSQMEEYGPDEEPHAELAREKRRVQAQIRRLRKKQEGWEEQGLITPGSAPAAPIEPVHIVRLRRELARTPEGDPRGHETRAELAFELAEEEDIAARKAARRRGDDPRGATPELAPDVLATRETFLNAQDALNKERRAIESLRRREETPEGARVGGELLREGIARAEENVRALRSQRDLAFARWEEVRPSRGPEDEATAVARENLAALVQSEEAMRTLRRDTKAERARLAETDPLYRAGAWWHDPPEAVTGRAGELLDDPAKAHSIDLLHAALREADANLEAGKPGVVNKLESDLRPITDPAAEARYVEMWLAHHDLPPAGFSGGEGTWASRVEVWRSGRNAYAEGERTRLEGELQGAQAAGRTQRTPGPTPEARAAIEATQRRIKNVDQPGIGRTMKELIDDLETARMNPDEMVFMNPGRAFAPGEGGVMGDLARSGITEAEGHELYGSPELNASLRQRSLVRGADGEYRTVDGLRVTGEDFTKVRGWIAVPKRVGDEILASYQGSPIGARVWDISKGKFSRLLLGAGNVSWLGFQVASNAFLSGLVGTGPLIWLRSQRWWASLPQVERDRLATVLGAPAHAADYEQKYLASTAANSTLVNAWHGLQSTAAWRTLHKANLPNFMFRMDRGQTNFFRRAVLYNHARREALARMDAAGRNAASLQDRFMGSMFTGKWDDRIKATMEQRADLERHGRYVDEILGDYLTYTAGERAYLQRLVMFYGFLRHSTRLVLWTLPTKHPVTVAILGKLALLGAQESRDILGGDQLPWGLGRVYWRSGGKVMQIDLARMNPAVNAFTEIRSTEQLTRVFPPIVAMAVEQVSHQDLFHGRPWRVRGMTAGLPSTSRPEMGGYTATDQLLALVASLENTVPILRYPKAIKFHGPQGNDATLIFGARPTEYRRPDVVQSIRQQEAAQGKKSLGTKILETTLPVVPRESTDPGAALRERQKRELIRRRKALKKGARAAPRRGALPPPPPPSAGALPPPPPPPGP